MLTNHISGAVSSYVHIRSPLLGRELRRSWGNLGTNNMGNSGVTPLSRCRVEKCHLDVDRELRPVAVPYYVNVHLMQMAIDAAAMNLKPPQLAHWTRWADCHNLQRLIIWPLIGNKMSLVRFSGLISKGLGYADPHRIFGMRIRTMSQCEEVRSISICSTRPKFPSAGMS
jgi:hypothetical protein